MLRYLLLLPLIFCLNIFADVSLSSPKIKLNDKDQRIIEFKIENESINPVRPKDKNSYDLTEISL